MGSASARGGGLRGVSAGAGPRPPFVHRPRRCRLPAGASLWQLGCGPGGSSSLPLFLFFPFLSLPSGSSLFLFSSAFSSFPSSSFVFFLVLLPFLLPLLFSCLFFSCVFLSLLLAGPGPLFRLRPGLGFALAACSCARCLPRGTPSRSRPPRGLGERVRAAWGAGQLCSAEHGSVVGCPPWSLVQFLPTKTGLWWRFAFRAGFGRPPPVHAASGLGRVVFVLSRLVCLFLFWFFLVFGR